MAAAVAVLVLACGCLVSTSDPATASFGGDDASATAAGLGSADAGGNVRGDSIEGPSLGSLGDGTLDLLGPPTGEGAPAATETHGTGAVQAALEEAAARLSALDGSDGSAWESRDVEGGLTETAVQALEGYRDTGASLAHAGYLDLLGNAWGCAVTGDGWAEVCVVSERAGGERCRVSRLHLDAGRWEELCGAR